MNKNLRIYLCAILAMFFWAGSFILTKIVFENQYRPIMTIFIRLVISSIILYVAVRLMKKKQKIDKADYWKFMVLGLMQPFFYFLGESFGLTLVSSTVASVIISTIPVVTPIFAFIFLKERISVLNIIGLIISFFGILLIVFNADYTFDASPLGVGLMFFAVSSSLVYAVFVKRLSYKYSPYTIITSQNILGVFYFLPLFLIFDFKHFILIKPNTELVLSLLGLAIFASSLAYLLFTSVIKEIGISKANMFTNLIPVFTAFFSYIILSESFTLNKIIGILIVIVGVMISQIFKVINKMIF